MSIMGRRHREGASDARGRGDAVWVVPRTEVVTEPARVGFLALCGEAGARAAVEAALASFGTPLGARDDAAIAEARQILAELRQDFEQA